MLANSINAQITPYMFDASVEVYCESRHGLPQYAHMFDAGMDVQAFLPNTSDTLILYPNGKLIVPTGLYFAIPNGFEFQVRPRSGLSYKTSVKISNAPGTIDSPYRGELGIILENTGPQFTINDGDKIAQLVLAPVFHCTWKQVPNRSDLSETPRSCNGFGSTGV